MNIYLPQPTGNNAHLSQPESDLFSLVSVPLGIKADGGKILSSTSRQAKTCRNICTPPQPLTHTADTPRPEEQRLLTQVGIVRQKWQWSYWLVSLWCHFHPPEISFRSQLDGEWCSSGVQVESNKISCFYSTTLALLLFMWFFPIFRYFLLK